MTDREAVPIDQIVSALNPCRARDLEWILRMVLSRARVPVALAFTELSHRAWATQAGFDEAYLSRWLAGKHKLPLGAAFRLAKVIGVDCELLFEHYIGLE